MYASDICTWWLYLSNSTTAPRKYSDTGPGCKKNALKQDLSQINIRRKDKIRIVILLLLLLFYQICKQEIDTCKAEVQ